MNEIWVSDSFAKINLGLNVLERLPNGYHRIETGFCFIDWSDRFEISFADETELILSDESIPVDGTNLIIRAYDLLKKETGLRENFKINVQKRIPVGAGLGGGSSNAATTLKMLNRMANLGLSESDLAAFGKKLGADVPFFVHGKTGIGTGLGTEIEELDIQPDYWIITVFPGMESKTSEAYAWCQPNPEPDFSLRSILIDDDPEEWQFLLQNDLEAAVFPRLELVGNVKDQFYEFGAEYASMSGSGSSVFGIFEQDFVAIDAFESFHKLGFKANITKPHFKPDTGIYKKEIES